MLHRMGLPSLSGWFVVFVLSLGLASSIQATSLTLSGGWSFQYGSSSTVVLAAGKITNNATGGNSGSLRLELWAFSTPYDGSALPGYRLAQYQLAVLNGGFAYNNVSSGSVAATLPPTGTWHMALLLTEYNGTSYIVRDYLLATTGQTLECTGGSCTVVVPPPRPARAEVSTNRSHYTLNKADTLLLSGIIEAGSAEGTVADIFIRVSVNGDAPLYLDTDMQWKGVEKPVVSQFPLTDFIAPDFYSLPSHILPEGTYKFEILVADSHPQPNALHTLIAHAEVLTTVWPKPVIELDPPQRNFVGQVGIPFQFDFAPWVSGGTPPYYFVLGTMGGFPPMGIVLQPNGMLTGTPSIARGTPSLFMVCAVDLAGNSTRDCVSASMVVDPGTPPPPPPAGAYDGTYDFSFVHPVQGGTNTVPLPRFFTVRSGVISSSDGTISGTVTDPATGAVRFTGPCWTSSGGTATWTGTLSAGALKSGGGNYSCQNGISGGSWGVSNGF